MQQTRPSTYCPKNQRTARQAESGTVNITSRTINGQSADG